MKFALVLSALAVANAVSLSKHSARQDPVSFKPKIEPAPDSPIMHTTDWIHAIVLGPDEVPPALPTEEISGSSSSGYSGSGSSSGSGSGSGSAAAPAVATAAPCPDCDVTAAIAGIQAAIGGLDAKLDATNVKLGALQGGAGAAPGSDAGSAGSASSAAASSAAASSAAASSGPSDLDKIKAKLEDTLKRQAQLESDAANAGLSR